MTICNQFYRKKQYVHLEEHPPLNSGCAGRICLGSSPLQMGRAYTETFTVTSHGRRKLGVLCSSQHTPHPGWRPGEKGSIWKNPYPAFPTKKKGDFISCN